MEESIRPILGEIQAVLPDVVLTVSAPMSGRSHQVYVLRSTHGDEWSLRIAKDSFAALAAARSVVAMRHIKQMVPAIQIPKVIYSARQYSVMEYVRGTSIGSWNLHSLSVTRRHTVLEGLAVFLYKLWTCPVPSTESENIETTYRAWLLDEVDKGIRRSILNTGWDNPLTFLNRRAKVETLVPEVEGRGLTVRHGDLNALNVIVDQDGLSGIIDWDTVAYVPAPAAIQPPLFIANVPGFRNDNVPEDMNFAEDRAYLEAAIRRVSTPEAATVIADLLATSTERQFFEMSLRNKRINEEYIRLRVGNADVVDKKMMIGQLESFLMANEDLSRHASIVELRRNLTET